MQRAWLAVGIGAALPLSFSVVVFAFVGLNPTFSWVPEIPFLGSSRPSCSSTSSVPGCAPARMTGSVRDGALAAALAGAIGGAVAGVCYVMSGRSAANLAILPVLGAVAGAVVGAAAAFIRR